MTEMAEWRTDKPPHDKWVKVLCDHGPCGVECIARLGLNPGWSGDRHWTFAPESHIWGPILGWRDLKEGERP